MASRGTPKEFIVDVERWCAKAKLAPAIVIVDTIQTMNEEIVTRWPVLTGFSRGSWFAQIGERPGGQGGVGQDSLARCNFVAATMQMGQVYYMGNTAEYALRLELGFVGQDSLGREYNQRGRYIVTTVVGQASAYTKAAIARLKAGNARGPNPGGGGAVPGRGIV